jgi:hypothetical protein
MMTRVALSIVGVQYQHAAGQWVHVEPIHKTTTQRGPVLHQSLVKKYSLCAQNNAILAFREVKQFEL